MKRKEVFNGFTVFVVTVCALTLFLNLINGRFHLGDFNVYYSAAQNFVSGGRVYLVSFYTGSGFYKYSPAILYFFLPYTIFPFKVAAIIHYLILGTCYWYTFTIIRRLVRRYLVPGESRHEMLLLSAAFACILIHFTREMYLGNINIILLMLGCLAIEKFLQDKQLPGGILAGIMILAKPYLVILLLPLFLRKKWKIAGWTCLAVFAGLVLPFIYPGPHTGFSMYAGWIRTILEHGEGFPGKTSLDFFIRFICPAWPVWGILPVFLAVMALVSVFIFTGLRREKHAEDPSGMASRNFLFEWFLIMALLPNLIRTDWVLLLFTAPLIVYMVFKISSRKLYRVIPLLIILLFFYGANSDDLLGRALSHSILEAGLMGIGNFLLVVLAVMIYKRHNSETSASADRAY